jgi:hypothetical protein
MRRGSRSGSPNEERPLEAASLTCRKDGQLRSARGCVDALLLSVDELPDEVLFDEVPLDMLLLDELFELFAALPLLLAL